MVRFRILGPLEAFGDGGEPVALGRGKESALLAILLLHANEPLSTDRLIEELWRDATPGTASKTVQVYVSRLRKRLPDNRLVTTPAGYLLRVEQGESDSDLFEQLAGQGRDELRGGDASAAEGLFSRALALWRGPALAEFRFESFAQIEIRRLDEFRAVVRCDSVDARLALGETERLVPELEELVAESPLQERPRGQLMLALYRAGRQAEALEVYRQTRTLLADELGIEPGPNLQALERAVLNHDPSLTKPQSSAQRIVARRGGRLLVAGGLAILAAAVAAGVLVATNGPSSSSMLAAGAVGQIDPGSLHIKTRLFLEGDPSRIAADKAGTDVWVGGDQAGTLSEVDTHTRTVRRVTATPGFPSAVAVGEGAVWVLDGASGLVTKVDPAYGSPVWSRRVAPRNLVSYDRSRQSLDPTSVAAGLGSVWTTDGSNWLTRLNPRTRHVDRIDLHSSLDGVAVGDGGVWAISGAAATIFRVDRRGRETMHVTIASKPSAESPYPIDVAVGAGYVWVLNANTATVTAIDPRQRLVAAMAHLGIQRRPVRLAAGDGAAWVADGDGTLARINEASPGQPEFLQAGGALRDVAVVGKAIWVTAGAGPGGAGIGTVSSSAAASRVRPLPTSICSPIYSESGTRPQYLIAGDLALQGWGGTLAAQAGQAIQFILNQHHFRAGRYAVGYQSCDNTAAGAGYSAPAKCAANAHAYASDRSVLGLIGSWSSGCSEAQLPITNHAPGGPLAMVAPTNTYVGLTHRGPGTAPNEPAKYYPTGTRNYVRVSAADDVQGAADALLAHRVGARRVFVLRDGGSYGDGIAADFTRAARRLGLTIVGPSLWNAPKSNRAFLAKVIHARADAVFLGTFLGPETAKLIKDLRAALPRRTQLIAPDGFDPNYLVASVGAAAEGMMASDPSLPSGQLPPRGRAFVDAFERTTGNALAAPSTIAAAQATEVLLTAIAQSNGTRGSVVKQLFHVRVTNGILGSFTFDHNGDTTAGAVTIYRITNGAPTIFKVITPPAELVH